MLRLPVVLLDVCVRCDEMSVLDVFYVILCYAMLWCVMS